MPASPYADRTATGALPTRLVPPDLRAAPPPAAGGPRLATASLVLGIVSLVANLLLLPTVLSVVFGVVGLAKGTPARARAVAGIVLGVVGILAACIQLSILIPVFLATQGSAEDSSVRAALADDKTALVGYAADHDGRLPERADPAGLAQYGWDSPGTVSRVDYVVGSGAAAGSFCLVATSRQGHRFMTTTHTAIVPGGTCPATW